MAKCPLCGSNAATITDRLYEGDDGMLYELHAVRPGPDLLTLEDVALLCRITVKELRYWIEKGDLVTVRAMWHLRVWITEADRFRLWLEAGGDK